MRIIRAEHLGMCFGVRDAIALALDRAASGPLTILGDLVHNPAVLATLRANDIAIVHDPAMAATSTLMVTAHGASERTLSGARALGLDVVEATCPLVRTVHQAIAALRRDGYHPVIIGQRAHVEVRGLTEDLDDFDVVIDETDIRRSAPIHASASWRRPRSQSTRSNNWSRSSGSASRSRTFASSTRSVSPPSSARTRPPIWRVSRRRHRRRRRRQQQHARTRGHVPPSRFARAPRRNGRRSPADWFVDRTHGRDHGRHVHARRHHRSG